MKKTFNARFLILASIVVIAAISRLLPHPPNVTPIMALSLLSGAFFSDKRFAFVVPVFAMLLSDIFLGFHSSMPAVYISFILGVMVGFLLNRKLNAGRVILASLSGSIIFFVLTNLWVWAFSGGYPIDFAGLADCFTKAVPFYRYAMAGDLVYTGVLFGSYKLAERYIPAQAATKA